MTTVNGLNSLHEMDVRHITESRATRPSKPNQSSRLSARIPNFSLLSGPSLRLLLLHHVLFTFQRERLEAHRKNRIRVT